MINYSIILGLSLIFLLNGCTAVIDKPELKVYHDTSIDSGMHIIRQPSLETINTVEIGDNIYEKSYLMIYDTFNASFNDNSISYLTSNESDNTNNFANKVNSFLDNVTPGKVSDNVSAYHIDINKIDNLVYIDSNNSFKAICSFYYSDYNECLVDRKNNGIFTHTMRYDGTMFKLTKPVKYTSIQTPAEYKEKSFKYIVLYQGKVDNKIKMSFREFTDNIARPAFTQDIDYELSKDGITMIGFKGLRIEIIKVTNMNITYKVINDYN